MAWTSDKIKQLTKLWNKGKSTVEIARELGISKNAVVGKVHRLGLDARPSPIRVPKTIVPIPAKSTQKSHQKEKISLLDLKINSCRWPYGEPGTDDFHFCGKDAQTGKPYCPEHCKIAYTSLKELALESARNKKENKPAIVLHEEVTATASSRKNADIKSSNPAAGKEASKPEASVPAKPEKKAEKKVADKQVKISAKAEPTKKAAASKASAKASAKAQKKAEKKAADKQVKISAKAEPAKKAAASKASAKASVKTEKKAEKKAADKQVKISAKAEPAKKAAASKASAKASAKAQKKAEKKSEKKEKAPQKAPKEPQVSKNLLSKGVKSVKEKLLKGSNQRK